MRGRTFAQVENNLPGQWLPFNKGKVGIVYRKVGYMELKVKQLVSLAVSTALVVTSLFIPKIDSQAATGGIASGNIDSGSYGTNEEIKYFYY